MISESYLTKEYINGHKSVAEIAASLQCSQSKVTYWLHKHGISKRSISDAIYSKHNGSSHPFSLQEPQSNADHFLYGLGLGLFWGEGNKVNKNSVRLGNTDPDLLRYFLKFLITFYNIDQKKLRFGIQIFSDCDHEEVIRFWKRKLSVPTEQFYKTIVTPSVRKGTYKRRSKYGVLTIYFSNTKLRDIIVNAIDELRADIPSR